MYCIIDNTIDLMSDYWTYTLGKFADCINAKETNDSCDNSKLGTNTVLICAQQKSIADGSIDKNVSIKYFYMENVPFPDVLSQ